MLRFSSIDFPFLPLLGKMIKHGPLKGDPMFYVMFILVVSSVLLGFGVLVTVLMCRIWGGEQGEANAFPGSRPVKEFPISMAA